MDAFHSLHAHCKSKGLYCSHATKGVREASSFPRSGTMIGRKAKAIAPANSHASNGKVSANVLVLLYEYCLNYLMIA